MSGNPDYPPERGLPGALARLLNEDWNSMTARANASPNHVSSDERWTRKAVLANPGLSDDQAYRLGQDMKKAHYVRMGKLSAEARRLAREAQDELAADEFASQEDQDYRAALRRDGRCPDCSYLLTAPGHIAACGGAR